MIDLVLEPFRSGIGQRTLAEVVLLGLLFGPLGVWVLLLRHAYAAESLSHAMLPGLVLAALAGVPLILGATAGIVAGAALIALAARDRRIGGDVSVAAAITALTGAGALLALTPEVPARLHEQLFGDLLGVTRGDLVVAGAACIVGLAGLAAAHRPLTLAVFDPRGARSLGVAPGRAEAALLVLLALGIVAGVRGLGSLLLLALLLAPAATALRVTARLGPSLALAGGLAVAVGIAGLYVTHFARLAAGASIALVAVALFGVSLLVRGSAAAPGAHGGPVEVLGEVR